MSFFLVGVNHRTAPVHIRERLAFDDDEISSALARLVEHDAIDEADIITTVTVSKTPVFDGTRVKDGAHVNGVGSYTPGARELDFALIVTQ